MRLIWRGPEFSEAVWGLQEGLRTGEEAGARRVATPMLCGAGTGLWQ